MISISLGLFAPPRRRDPRGLKTPGAILLSGVAMAPAAWADQSTAGNSASQGTPANQPVLTAGVFGASPGLTFDGVAKSMNIAHAASLNTGTGGYAIIATYKTPAAWWAGQVYRSIFDKSAGTAWSSTSDALGIGLAVGSSATIGAVHAGISTPIASSAVLSLATQYVIAYAFDGANAHSIRLNGAVVATAATGTNTNNNTNTLGIGVNILQANRFLQGDVGDIIFSTSALPTYEISLYERWLGNRRGITVA